MKKLVLLLCACALFFVPHKAHAQSIEACKQNACFGFGPPTGPANTNGYVYQDLSQTPPALYCPKNGVWVACGGSFTGALPNGSTATTQANGDNSTLVATDAFVLANGGVQTCPLTNATNICMTAAPYLASTAGATTTTLSGTFGVGTSGPVTSCSTFNAGNGVLITGAGASGANYIGTVVTCIGTTLIVTPATSTSKNAGTVVQHDETAAFLAAFTQLNTLQSCGTIWGPNGTYLVNGPLLDVGGANAVLPVPKIANYTANNYCLISLRGFQKPVGDMPATGFVIQTSNTTGNFIGGYDSATGGTFPPFTNVWLDLQNVTFLGPANPGMTMINAAAILDLTYDNLLVETTGSALPTNSAGYAIKFPSLANGVRLIGEGSLAIGGFYNGIVPGEHTQIGHAAIANYVNCVVADGGTNAGAPAGYQGNTISIDYLWCGPGTNGIVAGSNKTAINISTGDFESLTGNGVLDASNLLYGRIKYNVPYPNAGFSYCNLKPSGGSNLALEGLWCEAAFVPTSGLIENWRSQEGSGTTLANNGSDSTNSATTNASWASATGFTGTVATYNGTSQRSIASSAAQTAFSGTVPFTACAWINPATSGPSSFIMSNLNTSTGAAPGWRVGILSGNIDIYIIHDSSAAQYAHAHTTSAPISSAGTPYDVCVTYDGSGHNIGLAAYVNGAAVALTLDTDALTGSATSTAPLYIGGELDSTGWFNGSIGRVRVWNIQQSATNIATIHSLGINAF